MTPRKTYYSDDPPMRREFPPKLPRDVERERCVHCNSRGLLLDGYCSCGAVLCKLCKPAHVCEYD